MADSAYDLLVIGAGSGGVRAARMAAQAGWRVGIVEEKDLGGTCVNVGCVPKKLFYYASHVSEEIRDAADFGWRIEPPGFEWRVLRERKDREIRRLNEVYGRLLDDSGVDLIRGHGRFVSGPRLQVGDRTIDARHFLVATGACAYVPEFPGHEHSVTSDDLFYLDELPRRLVVVGGGYIAVEFAGIFNGLGVHTTQVYRGAPLLRLFDGDLRRHVTSELEQKGIDLRLETEVEGIERRDDGCLLIRLSRGEPIEADMVLYATGRHPNTARLGLEHTAVECRDNGAIVVNEWYQTADPKILAIGDVIGGAELTPLAIEQGMAVVDQLCHDRLRSVSVENLPTAIFCQPNLATVGLTEEQARMAYEEVDVYRSEFRALKHSLGDNPERTLIKLVVDRRSDRVLGAHMVGPDAGEIIQGIAVALNAGATKTIFDATIGIHPTAAEEFVTMRTPS